MSKVILITGSTRGIGKAISGALANSNYKVVGISNESVRNGIYKTYVCDINDQSQVRDTLVQIIGDYKRIDVLINNAGVIKFAPIDDYTEIDYESIFGINVKALFFFTREVVSIMKKQRSGYVINIGSTRAITAAPFKSLYSMSKFAMRSFTQSINLEFNKLGIKSTIICPGIVNTQTSRLELSRLRLDPKSVVQKSDIVKTILFLLELPGPLVVPEIILGGKL